MSYFVEIFEISKVRAIGADITKQELNQFYGGETMVTPKKFLFESDEHAKDVMTDYIKEHFGDVLGDQAKLLDQPNGLELVSLVSQRLLAETGINLRKPEQKAA
ncbi:MAG: hypothetical protein JKX97_00920 [Candidatus Lindowbacteria bacterium]|nr:hypothetical protein [Candidatus Lindowbacteria bacterium]